MPKYPLNYKYIYFLGFAILALLNIVAWYRYHLAATQTEAVQLNIPQAVSIPSPIRIDNYPDPTATISAQAIIAVDVKTGTVLLEKNATQALYPASTTKIITSLVALELFELDEIVVVKEPNIVIGMNLDLNESQEYSVHDLLYAILLSSGNDAALALAEHHPNGYQGFIDAMNVYAQQYGMTNSHFMNVSGLENTTHFVSAEDMSIAALELLKHEELKEIIATKEKIIYEKNTGAPLSLSNTNLLLGKVNGVAGIKTGWTPAAGECLVSYVNREGREVVLVLLGSRDRFGESELLIEWIYNAYQWQ